MAIPPPSTEQWDVSIDAARRALAASEAELARLTRKAVTVKGWKETSAHQSALALARRQVSFDQEALRAARLRALNGRIERIRRGVPAPTPPPEMFDLFLNVVRS